MKTDFLFYGQRAVLIHNRLIDSASELGENTLLVRELPPTDKAVLLQVLFPFVHLPSLFHHVLQHLLLSLPTMRSWLMHQSQDFVFWVSSPGLNLKQLHREKLCQLWSLRSTIGGSNTRTPDGDLKLKACPQQLLYDSSYWLWSLCSIWEWGTVLWRFSGRIVGWCLSLSSSQV